MTDLLILLRHLSDGQFHSGEDLAAELNVSRTAIWKQIKKLNVILSTKIMSIQSKGYKIEEPLSVLSEIEILDLLLDDVRKRLTSVEVLFVCPSTNQYLLEGLDKHKFKNKVVLAESQTQGRGRRGRDWVSPFASNVYMSVLWYLDISIAEMAGLSLVVAISVAQALQKCGVQNVQLKWPNDIYVEGEKLAGVLLELRGESNSPCHAVIGMGVNVMMPMDAAADIDQPWVDMQQLLKRKVNRNEVAAIILNELIPRLQQFNQGGFAGFISQWKPLDLLEGNTVNIMGHMHLNGGIARGVDENGALLVEHDGKVQPLYSGEVSIRLNDKGL